MKDHICIRVAGISVLLAVALWAFAYRGMENCCADPRVTGQLFSDAGGWDWVPVADR